MNKYFPETVGFSLPSNFYTWSNPNPSLEIIPEKNIEIKQLYQWCYIDSTKEENPILIIDFYYGFKADLEKHSIIQFCKMYPEEIDFLKSYQLYFKVWDSF